MTTKASAANREATLGKALADPRAALLELDKIEAEESLINFIRLLWPVLEPGRQFVDGWAVHAICEHLEAVTKGDIRRLLINVPPGCMKSLTTNVFWPAWEWGPRNKPESRYVCASYSGDLTVRDNRRCRALVRSELYHQLWGDRFQIVAEQDAKVRFDTDATGFKIATSVGGLGTGELGARFIIDEPHNIKETESDAKREVALQWFNEVVPTRISDAEVSAIVIIMQRVHERDISGLIIAKELGYEHLCLPMEYEEERKCMTSIGFKNPRTTDGELLWPERFLSKFLVVILAVFKPRWCQVNLPVGCFHRNPFDKKFCCRFPPLEKFNGGRVARINPEGPHFALKPLVVSVHLLRPKGFEDFVFHRRAFWRNRSLNLFSRLGPKIGGSLCKVYVYLALDSC